MEIVDKDKMSDAEVEERMECGYRKCTPKWLQVFNVPKGLLLCLCWFVFVEGFVILGINNVNTATIERRYDLTSSGVAWISSAYDISAAICALTFGYFGMFFHKGRALAIGAIFMAVGSLTMTLPHWLSGEYILGRAPTGLCDSTANTTTECTDSTKLSNYLYVFVIGQLLHGVGGAAAYTLGIPYLDENIQIKNTPVYIGILQACSALGPAVGYMAGGYFLSIYVDFGRFDKNEISIDGSDPRWVGAWWLAFLCAGIAFLPVAFFLGMFPRELPVAKIYRKERHSQSYKGSGDDSTGREKNKRSFKQIVHSLKLFFTNPTWIFLTLSGIFESGAVSGFATFIPKVIQFQFNLSGSTAAMWTGLLTIPGAAVGHLVGGLIPRCLHLRIRGMIIQCIICSVIGIGFSFTFLLRCDMADTAGINVHYQNTSYSLVNTSLVHSCNSHCLCTTNSYDPVCGIDDINYFSPCYAGCTEVREGVVGIEYHNCSCILANTTDAVSEWSQATAGICDQNCSRLPYFLLCFFIISFVTFVSATSGQAAAIRCVPDKQRSFSVGIQAVIVRFLGNVPGPLVLGAIFDKSCLVWQDKCGSQASCWIYDSQGLALGLCLTSLVVKVVSSLSFGLSLFFYKPPPTTEPPITKEVTPDSLSPDENVKDGNDYSENISVSDEDRKGMATINGLTTDSESKAENVTYL